MKIRGTVLCLPIKDLEKTFHFYKRMFTQSEIHREDAMIILELPKLSIFLMDTVSFETYSLQTGRKALFPTDDQAGIIISCALMSQEDVDHALQDAPKFGGKVVNKAKMDEQYDGYIGYISDPDGYVWELVFPVSKE